jgi:hypothetical protein
MYKRAADSSCLPVEAKGPDIGKIRPTLNVLSCAWAMPDKAANPTPTIVLKKFRLCISHVSSCCVLKEA